MEQALTGKPLSPGLMARVSPRFNEVAEAVKAFGY
jgi:hypothetical protein